MFALRPSVAGFDNQGNPLGKAYFKFIVELQVVGEMGELISEWMDVGTRFFSHIKQSFSDR